MSLINEALKKAQKQRQDEAAGASVTPVEPPPPPIPPNAPPASPVGPESEPDPVRQMRRQNASGGGLKYVAGVVGLIVVLGLGWWAFSDGEEAEAQVAIKNEMAPAIVDRSSESEVAENGDNSEPSPTRPPIQVEAPAAVVFKQTTESVAPGIIPEPVGESTVREAVIDSPPASAETPPPHPSASVAITPADPLAAPSSASPASNPAAEPVVAVESAVAPPAPVEPAARVNPPAVVTILDESADGTATVAASSAAEAQPVVISYLETAKVTGVRASPTDPKVLMNNRVYRLGEVVDRGLQLRITKIAARELQFTDARGYVYTKAF